MLYICVRERMLMENTLIWYFLGYSQTIMNV